MSDRDRTSGRVDQRMFALVVPMVLIVPMVLGAGWLALMPPNGSTHHNGLAERRDLRPEGRHVVAAASIHMQQAESDRIDRTAAIGGAPGPIVAEEDRLYRAVGDTVEAWRFDSGDPSPLRLGDSGSLGAPVQGLAVQDARVVIATGIDFSPGRLSQWDARKADAGRIDWRTAPTMTAAATGLLITKDRLWATNGPDSLWRFRLRGLEPPQFEADSTSRVKPSSLLQHRGSLMVVAPRVWGDAEPTPSPIDAYHAIVRLSTEDPQDGGPIEEENRVDLPSKRTFSLEPHWAVEEENEWGLLVWPGSKTVHRMRFDEDGKPALEPHWTLEEGVKAGAAMSGGTAWLVLPDRKLVGLDPSGEPMPLTSVDLPLESPAEMVIASPDRLWISGQQGRVAAVDLSSPRQPVIRGVVPSAIYAGVANGARGTWALSGDRLMPLEAIGQPLIESAIDLPVGIGQPRSLLADGSRLFVDTTKGLYPVDLGAESPSLQPSLFAPDHLAASTDQQAIGDGWVAAVVGLEVFVWPTHPPGGARESVLTVGSRAQVLTGDGTSLWLKEGTLIRRVDLADPLQPRLAEALPPLPSSRPVSMAVRDELAIIGTTSGQLVTADLSDLADVSLVGTLDMGQQIPLLAFEGERAWAVYGDGTGFFLSWVDVRIPRDPDERARVRLAGRPNALVPTANGVLVLTDGMIEAYRAVSGPPQTPRATETAASTATPAPTATTAPPATPPALWLPWSARNSGP